MRLAPREVEALYCIAMGDTVEYTAYKMGITKAYARKLLTNVREKLEVPSTTAAVAKAISMGILCIVFEFQLGEMQNSKSVPL